MKYRVIKDTREQLGWDFAPSSRCLGTSLGTLKTGDYTLEGFEDSFVIERKRNMGEFSANLTQKRWLKELDRLDEFAHAYLFLEFTWDDILEFPRGSGIPPFKWKYLKVRADFLAKTFLELQLAHPTLRVHFVGGRGKDVATSLFKRIFEHSHGGLDVSLSDG